MERGERGNGEMGREERRLTPSGPAGSGLPPKDVVVVRFIIGRDVHLCVHVCAASENSYGNGKARLEPNGKA